MRFPESWLRAFVDPPWTTERLSEALTMAGFEVEDVWPYAPAFDRVVVAEVRRVERHPKADKLTVCEVDTGERTHTIVCGAPNVAAGVRVPCALPGAVLPGGLRIAPVEMRGVQSEGMLCSARELGLSEDHSGLMLLPADAPVGRDLREYLDLDDAVLELKLTPNRPDCLGVVGIAREVAALSGAPLHEPAFEPVPVTLHETLPVEVSARDLCGRFSGRIIRGVDARAATPAWMRERLERAGQRSISALVDISNYVMLELGRPSHVFDLDRIHGGLHVRWGRPGETLTLLNGQTVELDGAVGVIADEQGVESLAGIMGGESTAVTLETRNVYVEAAFWWPEAIAGRARRFNFTTDAGHRFERGVDAETTVAHIEYLSRLILEICGGHAGPVDDTVLALPERKPVSMRIARARKVIGVDLPAETMARAFERLRLPYRREDDRFVVTPPSYRFDLQIEEDLIEEVTRLYGYERLPIRPPRTATAMRAAPEASRPVSALRHLLADRDYQEVINFSFVASGLDAQLSGGTPIRLLNPIAAPMDAMRTTLWSGLVESLRFNLNRKAQRVRLFEIGRTFHADASVSAGAHEVRGVSQPQRLALLAFGPALEEQWSMSARDVDFFDVKGDLEALLGSREARYERGEHPALHPGRTARVVLDGSPVGWIGSLHPRLQQALELPRSAVLAELLLEPLLVQPVPLYRDISKFPPAIRDLAVVVPQDVPAAAVRGWILDEVAARTAARAVKKVILFDEYRGKGLENKEKSLAFRIWMQDTERTLNEDEVSAALGAIVGRIEREGGRLRS